MMQRLRNLKTAWKLTLGFGLCLTLAVMVGAIALTRFAQLDAMTREISNKPLPNTANIAQLTQYVRQARTRAFQHLLETEPAGKAKFDKQMGTSLQGVQDLIASFETALRPGEETQAFQAFKSSWANYAAMNAQALQFSRQKNVPAALGLLNGEMKRIFDKEIEPALTTIAKSNLTYGKALASQSAALNRSARMQVLALLGSALLVGGLAGGLITRAVASPLARIAEAGKRLAMGDVDQRVEI